MLFLASKAITAESISNQLKRIEEQTRPVKLTNIIRLFIGAEIVVLVICVVYALYIRYRKDIILKDKLRKQLIVDKLIQNVTTVFLVPVATTVILQPDNVDGEVYIWTILFAIIGGGIILLCAITQETKNQENYSKLLSSYVLMRAKDPTLVYSINSRKIISDNEVLIPLTDSNIIIVYKNYPVEDIKLRLWGSELIFSPKILSRGEEGKRFVIQTKELVEYATENSLLPYFEIVE